MAHNGVKYTMHDAKTPLSKQCHVESSMDISTAGTDETLSSLLVLPAGPDCCPLLDGKQSLKPGQHSVSSSSATHRGKPDVSEGSTDRKSNNRMLSIGTPTSSNNPHQCTTKGMKSQNWLNRTKSDVLWQSPVEFKSFFSAECDDIVNKLRSKVAEGKSGSKRKLDVSLIEDEPPPFYSTPLAVQDAVHGNKRKRMDVSGSKRNLHSYFQSKMSPYRDFILTKPADSVNVSFRHKDANLSKGDDCSVPPTSAQSWASVSPKPFDNLTNPRETYWKKLAPIKEVSLDTKDSYTWRNKNDLNLTDLIPALYQNLDEHHTKPEYDSMFNSVISAECEDLIEKVKKSDHKNSLLMEKSSMLEVCLLDLDKMNVNLLDLNLLDETNSKAKAFSFPATTGGLVTCNFQVDMVRSGKCEGAEKCRNSSRNGPLLQLPVMDESSTITRSAVQSHFNKDLEIEVTSDSLGNVAVCTHSNAMNFIDPTGDVKSINQSLSDGTSKQNNFSIDKMTAVNIHEDTVSKSSNLAVVDLTKSSSSNSTSGYVANTHDLVLNPIKLSAVNVTQDILPDSNKTAETNLTTVSNPFSVADVTQDMVSYTSRMAAVNVTQEMVSNPSGMAVVNVTQEMVSNPRRMAVVNVTQEMVSNPRRMAAVNVTQEMEPNPSRMAVNVTQGMVSKPSGMDAVNVTKEMVSNPRRMAVVNGTQEMLSKPSGIAVVNVTQEMVTNLRRMAVVNVTQEMEPNPSRMAVNVTQEMEPNPSRMAVNVTQEMEHNPSRMAVNVTQEMEPNPSRMAVNVTQGMVSNPSRMAAVNVTQEMVSNLRRMAAVNVTQEMVSNPRRMAVVNVTQEMVSNRREKMFVSVGKDVLDHTVVMHVAKDVSNQSGTTVANVLKDLVSYPGETAGVHVIRDTASNHTGTVLLNLTQDMSEPSRKAEVNLHDSVSKIGGQSVGYTSMDLSLKSESVVIDVTQDLVSEQSVVAVNNATQDMVSNEVTALNGTKEIFPTSDRTVGIARMKTNCVGATSSITPHVLMNRKLASNKQMNLTFSMNRKENEFLSTVNSLATRNQNQLPGFPVAADQITEDSSEHVDVTTENEVQDGLKQSATQPEKLEPWDTALDDSVLSNRSLSFVTSTPVTGFSNYHFILQSGKPMQYDPHVSFSTEAPQTKELKRPLETKLLKRESLVNKGLSKGSVLPCIRKSNVPAAEETRLVAATQIPSLGRGFLPCTSQKLIKEPVFPQIQPSENSVRAIVRPSLGRIGLPRSVVTSVRKNTGKAMRKFINHKRSGSIFKIPETGITTVESHVVNSQVPKGTLNKKRHTTVAQEPTTKIAPLTSRPKTASAGCRKDFRDGSICPPLATGSQMISHHKGPLRSGIPKLSKKT